MQTTLDEKTIKRIRNRASYKMFQQIYDFLRGKPDTADILKRFYDVLDSHNSFGSLQNAMYASESLVQVRKDNGIDIGQKDKLQEAVKMAKEKHPAAVPIKEGLFFPRDFIKLHQDYVIYIKEGAITDLNKL